LGLGAGLGLQTKNRFTETRVYNGSAKDQKSISTIPFFNSLTMSNFKSIHKRLNLKKTTFIVKRAL
jgi:hypothetical protein